MGLLALLLPAASAMAEALRLGVYPNPPLSTVDRDGNPDGFVVELLKHIAATEGWDLEFVACSWEECNHLLAMGGIEMLSPMSASEARQRRVDFNRESLYVNWGQIVMAGKEEIRSPLDLAGKTVVANSSDVHFADLKELAHRFDIAVRFIEVDDYKEVVDWVANGPVDAGLISRTIGEVRFPGHALVKSSVIFNPAEIRIALSPRNGQLANARRIQRLDYHLTRLKGDRQSLYYQLQKKWLGSEKVKLPRWVLWAFVGVLGFALFLLAGIMLLRRQVRKKTGELREMNEQFAAFMDNLPGVAYMKGAAGDYLFVNSTWQESNQLSLTDVIGRQPSEIWPERNLSGFEDAEAQVLDGGRAVETVETRPWDQQRRSWQLIRFPVVSGQTGERLIGGIGIDITEKRESEQKLAYLNRQLQHLLQSAGDGIFGLDGAGRCTFTNPAASRLLGYPEEKLVGHRLHELLQHSRADGEEFPEAESAIYGAYHKGGSSRVVDEVFWHANGNPLPVDFSAHPIADGEFPGAVVVFRERN